MNSKTFETEEDIVSLEFKLNSLPAIRDQFLEVQIVLELEDDSQDHAARREEFKLNMNKCQSKSQPC